MFHYIESLVLTIQGVEDICGPVRPDHRHEYAVELVDSVGADNAVTEQSPCFVRPDLQEMVTWAALGSGIQVVPQ